MRAARLGSTRKVQCHREEFCLFWRARSRMVTADAVSDVNS